MSLESVVADYSVDDVRVILYKLDNLTNYLYGQITDIDNSIQRRRIISDESLLQLLLAYRLIQNIGIDNDLPRMNIEDDANN